MSGCSTWPSTTDGAQLTGGRPTLEDGPAADELAAAVGLSAADTTGLPSDVAGCGLPFAYLSVAPGMVDRAAPDQAALDALGVGEGVSVLSWDAADVDRLRPGLRRRPDVG